MNLEALMNELNLTPEQLAFITIEALEQMVKDAKKKNVETTVAEIFEVVTNDPQGTTAEYFKVYLKLGVDAIELVRNKNSSK